MRRKTTIVFTVFLALAACARPGIESPLSPLSPRETPASASVPASTAPPTPRPTWTPSPVPTPTPQPIPTFPPEAAQPEGWPPLPADLYFIRDDSLWRWPQTGGDLEQVVAAPAVSEQGRTAGGKHLCVALGGPFVGLATYRLASGAEYLVYASMELDPDTDQTHPVLTALDLTTDISVTIPTVGDFTQFPIFDVAQKLFFDITPDGRYVIYPAWGTHPNSSSRAPRLTSAGALPDQGDQHYGTIYAVDVNNPNRLSDLGYCAARSVGDFRVDCGGFVLSPDGKRIAFSDGWGVWLSEVPQGSPRLLAENQYTGNRCGIWRVRNWSPDGRKLLIDVGCYEGGYAAVMDATTGETQVISRTWRYGGPYVNSTWSQNGEGILVSEVNSMPRRGTVYLAQVSAEDTAQVTVVISDTWPGTVWPTDPHDLPDDRIGFANQLCVDSPGPGPGIYAVKRDGAGLELISPLPAMPCYTSDVGEVLNPRPGTILWSPDGAAYLYFEYDKLRAYQPVLLGLTDGSVLWDVRELLRDARDFQWQP